MRSKPKAQSAPRLLSAATGGLQQHRRLLASVTCNGGDIPLQVVCSSTGVSSRPLVTVDVEAVIVHPERGEAATSNTFTFTFSLEPRTQLSGASAAAVPLKRVLPQNGEEAARQLEVRALLLDDA